MKLNLFIYALFTLLILASCRGKSNEADPTEAPTEVRTPVTVTSIEHGALQTFVEVNATASYLQYNFIKASTNGYLLSVDVKLGQMVREGQPAFILQTKESHALGNTINNLDTSFHLTGKINIRSSANGFVQELNHQVGDYVQDGEQLAVLSVANSFGFVLNVPFELRRYVSPGKSLVVTLPDGNQLDGVVSSMLPTADSVSQTQRVLLRVNASFPIPQNLVAKVQIPKENLTDATSLPKAAVLTNEAQTSFWVMKMIDSATAVRVPVEKGIETKNKVQILKPQFSAGDKILLTGNYGLGDTAKVKIVNAEP